MVDGYGRNIDYLRISITDKCNLSCRYCAAGCEQETIGAETFCDSQTLNYDELYEIVTAAAGLGIKNIKITGGEPLVRPGCAEFIASIKKIPGVEHVTLTTNGTLLAANASALHDAGLDGVNISLDSFDERVFSYITGNGRLETVKQGINAALEFGIRTKINCVLMKGINDEGWKELAELAKDKPVDVRFIEMMPLGEGKLFECVENSELLKLIEKEYGKAVADGTVHGFGPAAYVKLPGFSGSIGFISAVHNKFCSSCNRIRIMADGRLKSCLCFSADEDLNLLKMMRSQHIGSGKQDNSRRDEIEKMIRTAIERKPLEHCFDQMDEAAGTEQNRMNKIGG